MIGVSQQPRLFIVKNMNRAKGDLEVGRPVGRGQHNVCRNNALSSRNLLNAGLQ